MRKPSVIYKRDSVDAKELLNVRARLISQSTLTQELTRR